MASGNISDFFLAKHFSENGKKLSQIPILKIKKICLQVTESCYFGEGVATFMFTGYNFKSSLKSCKCGKKSSSRWSS
jgi:hypothetical protein